MKSSSYGGLSCGFNIASWNNQASQALSLPLNYPISHLGPKYFTTTCNWLLIHCLLLRACLTSRNPLSLHLYSHIFSSCQNHIKHTVPVTQGCQCLARCFSQSFIKPYNPPWPCQFIKLPIFPHERSPPAPVYKCLHPWPFSGETNSFIWRVCI